MKKAVFLFLPLFFLFNAFSHHNSQQAPLPGFEDLVTQDDSNAPTDESMDDGTESVSDDESDSALSDDTDQDSDMDDTDSAVADDTSTSDDSDADSDIATDDEATSTDEETADADDSSSSTTNLFPMAQMMSSNTVVPGLPNTGDVPSADASSTDTSTTDATTTNAVAATTETTATAVAVTTEASANTTTTPPSTESATEPVSSTAVSSSTSPTDDSSTTPVTTDAASSSESQTSTSTATDTAATTGNVFSTGAVTFRFDDGWSSQLTSAVPVLNAAGIKGTFYIITKQLADDGFTGFVSSAQVGEIASAGHEIGAHTRTHPHLPTLSTEQQTGEIAGAKEDLQGMGFNPQTFSYPYGEYNDETLQIAQAAGYSSAVTTSETSVAQGSDRLQLASPSLTLSQSPAEIEQMIQSAVDSHQWLVLTFHRIDNSGDQYSITPENFQEVVDYVKSHNIPTVTVSEGAAQL